MRGHRTTRQTLRMLEMSTAYVADLDQIEFPALAPEGSTVFRIGAERLDVGMYVVELDRPWTDTPFPSGGLYLLHAEQVATLRAHCADALIDTARSDPKLESPIRVAAGIFDDSSDEPAFGKASVGKAGSVAPRADGAAAGRRTAADSASVNTAPAHPHAAKPRDDVRVSRAWRLRLRRLLVVNDRGAGLAAQDYGLIERARSWIAGASRPMLPGTGSMAGLRTLYGNLIGSTTHLSGGSLGAAVPQARRTYALVLSVDVQMVRAARDLTPLPWPLLEEAMQALAGSVIEHPDAILWCDRMHEQRSLGHRPAATPAVLMARFARHLGLPRDEIALFAAIGMVSDLGKVRLPPELLSHPGILSRDEFDRVKKHVAESLALLAGASAVPESVLRGVAEHHERANGSGYPAGLEGSAIGLYGACAAIVDCYSALTSARTYANPLSPEDALAALLGWSGALFDSALVEQFALATGLFPVGSSVELAGGGMGVVVDQNVNAPAASKVLVLTDPQGKALRSSRQSLPNAAGAGAASAGAATVSAGRGESTRVRAGERVRIARGLHVGAYGIKLPDYYSQATGARIG